MDTSVVSTASPRLELDLEVTSDLEVSTDDVEPGCNLEPFSEPRCDLKLESKPAPDLGFSSNDLEPNCDHVVTPLQDRV